MRRLRPLLALALVPLAAGHAYGDAPDLCSKLAPGTAVCLNEGTVSVTQIGEVGEVDPDPTLAAICRLLHASKPDLGIDLCQGTYTSSEICLILQNEANLGPYGEEILKLCMPLMELVCGVAPVCTAPAPTSFLVTAPGGGVTRVVDLPIG